MDPKAAPLLVIANRFELTNRLISDLRKSGLAVRAAGAPGVEAFRQQYNTEAWDAMIYLEDPGIDLAAIVAIVRDAALDIPFLVITRKQSRLNRKLLGMPQISNVVSMANYRRIVPALLREIRDYRHRNSLRQLQFRYRELEKRHRGLLETSPNAICHIRSGMHLYCNKSYMRLFGYANRDALMATPLLDLVSGQDRKRLNACLARPLRQAETLDVDVRLHDGSARAMVLKITPITCEGQPAQQIEASPARGNRHYAAARDSQAEQDLLTRLHKPKAFQEKIENAIAAAVNDNRFSALLLVRIDDFADIQDTIGKSGTNQVVRDIGHFLQSAIRKRFIASRVADNEFALLLYDGNMDRALKLARFIQGKINNKITAADLPAVRLSATVGIAAVNNHALDAAELLARARGSLGGSTGDGGDTDSADNGEIARQLTRALAEKDLDLEFQPIVDLRESGPGTYEVLCRLRTGAENPLMPPAFLPVVNMRGLGADLDRLVLDLALDRLAKTANSDTRLVVNLTPGAFACLSLLPGLSEALMAAGIGFDRLLLQISEIDCHTDHGHVLAFCRGMEELGLAYSISHFGCAVSALGLLKETRPAFVKLDETIIRDILYSQHQQKNVRQLIGAVHDAGTKVLCPHVENLDVLPVLWDVGADHVQGYCLQAPAGEMHYAFPRTYDIDPGTVAGRGAAGTNNTQYASENQS